MLFTVSFGHCEVSKLVTATVKAAKPATGKIKADSVKPKENKPAAKKPDGESRKVETKKVQAKPVVSRNDEPKRAEKPLASRGSNVRVIATAYSGCCPIQKTGPKTATGRSALKTDGVAVDPRVIPLGSRVEINGVSYIADDTGGAIKGNRIDVRVKDYKTAIKFGRRKLTVVVYPPLKK